MRSSSALPAGLRAPASGRAAPHFLKYLAIGGFVFVIDAGTFQILVWRHVPLPVGATIAYGAALVTHFSLNRWLNFRNFERTVQAQATTYATIVFFQWLITLGTIEAVVLLGFLPFVGKVVAVLVNIPIGFLAHRHVTFGSGLRSIRARLRSGVD